MESQRKEKAIELLDFTAQSGWEKATACVAQILRTCPKQDLSSCLLPAKFPTQPRSTLLRLTWYQGKYAADEESTAGDNGDDSALFPEQSELGLLFGLQKREDYILVVPSDDQLTGNTALLVLSAVSCAACECGVQCAFVVRYGRLAEPEYVGYCPPGLRGAAGAAAEGGRKTQGVHMVTQHIRNAPGNLRYLDGLFELALKKFNAVSPVPRVNVQYTYVAEDAFTKAWDSSTVSLSKKSLGHIPILWGPDKDPVTDLHVSLQWSHRERTAPPHTYSHHILISFIQHSRTTRNSPSTVRGLRRGGCCAGCLCSTWRRTNASCQSPSVPSSCRTSTLPHSTPFRRSSTLARTPP